MQIFEYLIKAGGILSSISSSIARIPPEETLYMQICHFIVFMCLNLSYVTICYIVLSACLYGVEFSNENELNL